jgi:hypothetical protein
MKYLATILVYSFIALPLHAQITISEADFLSINDAGLTHNEFTSTDVTGLSTIVATKGSNVSWALANRSWTSGSSSQLDRFNLYVFPGDAPLTTDPHFSAATHYNKTINGQQTTYNYYKVDTAGIYLMGQALVDAGYPSIVYTISPAIRVIAFPLTLGTHWLSNSQITEDGQTGDIQIIGTCDAFGSLTTPTSASHQNEPTAISQVLRINYSQVISPDPADNYYLFYGYDHSMAIYLDPTLGTPQYVDYSQTTGAGVENSIVTDNLHLTLSNNPAFGDHTSLSYEIPTDGNVRITIADPLGREIRTLQTGFAAAGKYSIFIDENNLSAGTYFVRVDEHGTSAMQKLVVVK